MFDNDEKQLIWDCIYMASTEGFYKCYRNGKYSFDINIDNIEDKLTEILIKLGFEEDKIKQMLEYA